MRDPQMFMQRVVIGLVAASACWFVFALKQARADEASAPASVNLFPAQTFDSLSNAPSSEVPPAPLDEAAAEPEPPPPPPPEPPLPFSAVALWKDGARDTFAVEGLGRTFLFCLDCKAPGAVHPGQSIANGYRLEKIGGGEATLVGPSGKEQSMPLIGMAH
ncbi:hypothetical protein [Burkholderia ubonensis]|nr:hypothetical protein [Burkholderia ubonensis]